MRKSSFFLLLLLCLIAFCSCDNSNDNNGSGYEIQDIKMLNLAMANTFDNFTCKCSSVITSVVDNEKISNETSLKVLIQGEKSYSQINTNGYTIEIYNEKNSNGFDTFISTDGECWLESTLNTNKITKDQLGIFDFGIITEEMFEYFEGVWIGNIEILNNILEKQIFKLITDATIKYKSIENVKLEKFNIEISDGNLKRQNVIISFNGYYQDIYYTSLIEYRYSYTKIGATIVNKPIGVPN